jgi:hypothetical protein
MQAINARSDLEKPQTCPGIVRNQPKDMLRTRNLRGFDIHLPIPPRIVGEQFDSSFFIHGLRHETLFQVSRLICRQRRTLLKPIESGSHIASACRAAGN